MSVSARFLGSARRHIAPASSSQACLFRRCFSSNTSPPKEEFEFEDGLPNKQDFVKVRLEPGEWDIGRTDPIYRPPWKNKARVISAEDFANRPRAGFDNEFESPYDAMVILSWMDRSQQEKIYQSYQSLMIQMSEKEKVTSHEYVMRVIAQKYNITASRVAGIVQLLHNEDQIRKQHPEQKIYYETQEYVDKRMAEHIATVYDAFKQDPPSAPFVEDPVGVVGMGDIDRRTSAVKEAGDELDYDVLVEKARLREQRAARAWIDNYVYVEDVDEDTIKVQTTADCNKLLKAQEQLKRGTEARPEMISPLPENGQGQVRPRWKYIAETINTREQKKRTRRNTKKLMKNAIVEQDGNLRVASVWEVKHTTWKPERHPSEFIYKGVKQAWLERTLEGKTDGWGHVERPTIENKTKEIEATGEGEEVPAAAVAAIDGIVNINADEVEEAEAIEDENPLMDEMDPDAEEEDDPKK